MVTIPSYKELLSSLGVVIVRRDPKNKLSNVVTPMIEALLIINNMREFAKLKTGRCFNVPYNCVFFLLFH